MKILALSKVVFDRLMIEKKVTPENVEQQDRILFISINEQENNLPAEYHPYFPEDKDNVKVMYFSDVEKDLEVTKLDRSGEKIKVYAMTREQAADLYSFIKDNIKGKDAVLIHCTAGVSRSGAVASFINDYVSGSWEMFKRDNDSIQPNAHVYRLLYDEWHKDLEFPPRWSDGRKKEFQIELMNPLTPEQASALSDERQGTRTTTHLMTKSEIVERWGAKILEDNKKFIDESCIQQFKNALIKGE